VRVFAPGKIVITGAYAVLKGAPALSIATSRGAVADDSSCSSSPTPEVRCATGESAPSVDACDMFLDGRKLGLGASSAIVVASLGTELARAGEDLLAPSTRQRLFGRAWSAHRAAQHGGSGVDIATSTYGGAIVYRMGASVLAVPLMPELIFRVFACPKSAVTSQLLRATSAFEQAAPEEHAFYINSLATHSQAAIVAWRNADAPRFLASLRSMGASLADFGDAAGISIVPNDVRALAELAHEHDASFTVSGAGGGDIAVYFGTCPPRASFVAAARERGLLELDVAVDTLGVRTLPPR
jgi:phosphomevalonate kinase